MTNCGRSLHLLIQQNFMLNVTEAGSEGQQVNSLSRGDRRGRNKGCESLTATTGSMEILTRAAPSQMNDLGDRISCVKRQRFFSRPAWETGGQAVLLCLSLITGSVPSQGHQLEGPDLPFISQVLLAPLRRNPV